MKLSVSNPPLKLPVPRGFFLSAKDAVLGKNYELSVVFVTSTEMKKLNTRYREKSRPTDILSFPLSPTSGEIIFCLAEVTEQARVFDRTPLNFLKFLFIHGLLHLKGLRHGSRMEREEIKFRKKFGI
ncbi:MAG: rRNA maturation RNase YbeY [Candidatus Taylorbacteria bacterium RIFCSPHIGHO2_01_FULL_51_15]|uniref:Endoribonuclease YbeY n=1 Tax=Candidatus Taylorbacteria bacterium RIFCSPHIGHO2_01_FULL_51_15 TaxID=1802304 RepID=A0A1G2MC27_9BACT|nr:MAG: rRNA maturation RNase YbeY [Candidatus Taylorbacteria bacterium RIFCSPHIGHO2_01_FULL_51_15]